MENEEKKRKPKEPTVKIKVSGATMVVRAKPEKGKPKLLAFDDKTASRDIVWTASGYIGQVARPYVETMTETVERSKGLGAGFRFAFEILKLGKLEFEKKPTKEVRKIKKVIWNPHKK
jgi:hypothetical protein